MRNPEIQEIEWTERMVDETLGHFVIKAICQDKKRGDQFHQAFERDGGKLLVEFRVNGVELDFRKTIEDLYQTFHNMVEERAVELVKQRVDDKYHAIMDELDKVRDAIRNHRRTLFPGFEERD